MGQPASPDDNTAAPHYFDELFSIPELSMGFDRYATPFSLVPELAPQHETEGNPELQTQGSSTRNDSKSKSPKDLQPCDNLPTSISLEDFVDPLDAKSVRRKLRYKPRPRRKKKQEEESQEDQRQKQILDNLLNEELESDNVNLLNNLSNPDTDYCVNSEIASVNNYVGVNSDIPSVNNCGVTVVVDFTHDDNEMDLSSETEAVNDRRKSDSCSKVKNRDRITSSLPSTSCKSQSKSKACSPERHRLPERKSLYSCCIEDYIPLKYRQTFKVIISTKNAKCRGWYHPQIYLNS